MLAFYTYLPTPDKSLIQSTLQNIETSSSEAMKRLLVLKLFIKTLGEAILHTGAALVKLTFTAVQLPLSFCNKAPIFSVTLGDTRDHVARAAKLIAASILVPLPALISPTFAVRSYKRLELTDNSLPDPSTIPSGRRCQQLYQGIITSRFFKPSLVAAGIVTSLVVLGVVYTYGSPLATVFNFTKPSIQEISSFSNITCPINQTNPLNPINGTVPDPAISMGLASLMSFGLTAATLVACIGAVARSRFSVREEPVNLAAVGQTSDSSDEEIEESDEEIEEEVREENKDTVPRTDGPDPLKAENWNPILTENDFSQLQINAKTTEQQLKLVIAAQEEAAAAQVFQRAIRVHLARQENTKQTKVSDTTHGAKKIQPEKQKRLIEELQYLRKDLEKTVTLLQKAITIKSGTFQLVINKWIDQAEEIAKTGNAKVVTLGNLIAEGREYQINAENDVRELYVARSVSLIKNLKTISTSLSQITGTQSLEHQKNIRQWLLDVHGVPNYAMKEWNPITATKFEQLLRTGSGTDDRRTEEVVELTKKGEKYETDAQQFLGIKPVAVSNNGRAEDLSLQKKALQITKNQAAKSIQSTCRGYLARKVLAQKPKEKELERLEKQLKIAYEKLEFMKRRSKSFEKSSSFEHMQNIHKWLTTYKAVVTSEEAMKIDEADLLIESAKTFLEDVE